jgi:hypothetical protein
MTGFDFTAETGTWRTDSEIGYPVFQWQERRSFGASVSSSTSMVAGAAVELTVQATDAGGAPPAGR